MLTLRNEHFQPDLSSNLAEALFKESVNCIELAISSYCNRRCRYCPNYLVDRYSTEHLMSDSLFDNILKQLCKINYSRNFTIHRYNEPLANKYNALLRISQIRELLPQAKILVYTNGDYLDKFLVTMLADFGVDTIHATLHLKNQFSLFDEYKEMLAQRVSALNICFDLVENPDDHSCRAVASYSGMKIDYQIVDFWAKKNNGAMRAYDRGGAIGNKGFFRMEPCLMPFVQLQIDYDGTLLPCCNIHPQLEKHKQYVLGKLTDTSNIFVEWTSMEYVRWRQHLITFDLKKSPCTHCDMNT